MSVRGPLHLATALSFLTLSGFGARASVKLESRFRFLVSAPLFGQKRDSEADKSKRKVGISISISGFHASLGTPSTEKVHETSLPAWCCECICDAISAISATETELISVDFGPETEVSVSGFCLHFCHRNRVSFSPEAQVSVSGFCVSRRVGNWSRLRRRN